MTNTASYKKWLIKNDISRPHLSGRWRLRRRDVFVINIRGIYLSVGGFYKQKPTKKEYDFFCEWRDSIEYQHKKNLVGFLRFAFSKRHMEEVGKNRVRQIARFVLQSLVAFANGNEEAGIKARHNAWCEYMIVMQASCLPLVYKGMTKRRLEETLKKAQPLGTEANKDIAKNKKDKLNKTMEDYINNSPNALVLGPEGLLEFLKKTNLTYGYQDSTIKNYAKPFFRDKRKALKMERK